MKPIPSGTVTFLFTDIQGSTKLWQNFPNLMKTSLRRHDDILRGAIERNKGYVFKTVGDAFCAAFDTAIDCMNACLAIQLGLKKEKWETPVPILVRMGFHTGEAEERDGDYFGPALNRAARLQGIAHGGQVLVSLVSAELIRDILPESISLKDMGLHRLKDLTRPESVYQLTHPDLPSKFPPLNSLDRHIHNLPVQATRLLGREKEVEKVRQLLTGEGAALVTLTGPGGIGKTRLALQTGGECVEDFQDGVFFVDLSPLDEPGYLIPVIARTLGIKESEGCGFLESMTENLRSKKMLIILDNFEQIIQAEFGLIPILKNCPGVRFLVTSREPLKLRDERVFAVKPLSVPENYHGGFTAAEPGVPFAGEVYLASAPLPLTQYDAVRLFIDRAVAGREDFTVTNDNAPDVAEICCRLDGIPLAIELAAARVRYLSPAAIREKLSDKLSFLTGGPVDLPPRHRTLRAAIEWSYELLTEHARDLFCILSVFPAAVFLPDAEEVAKRCGYPDSVDDGIASLVDKSLLVPEEGSGGLQRYRMLETLRDYTREKLKGEGREDEVLKNFALYYSEAAVTGEGIWYGEYPVERLNLLDSEHDSIIEALNYLLKVEDYDTAMRMADALWPFWKARGHLTIGLDFLTRVQKAPGTVDTELRARVGIGMGILRLRQGCYEESEIDLIKTLEYCRRTGYDLGTAVTLHELGWDRYSLYDLKGAAGYFNESMKFAIDMYDPLLEALNTLGFGLIDWQEGNFKKAEENFNKCVRVFSSLNLPESEARAWGNLGCIEATLGDNRKALQCHEYAHGLLEKKSEYNDLFINAMNRADLYSTLGQFLAAIDIYESLIKHNSLSVNVRNVSEVFSNLASCYLAINDIETARKYVKEGLSLITPFGDCYELANALNVSAELNIIEGKKAEAKKNFLRAAEVFRKFNFDKEFEKIESRLRVL